MPLSQEIRFCRSRDGTRLAFATCGTGPPLVRVAYWLSHLKLDWDSPVWAPWIALLARRHTLIRYDARGCGLSDRTNVELSFERDIEDLEAVVQATKLDRFNLFGTTAGGATAIAYAARHLDRVARLVLMGCYSAGRDVQNQRQDETEIEIKSIEIGWANENPAFRQFFTSLFIPYATVEQARSINELMQLGTTPQIAASRLRIFHRHDLRVDATRIACPTLVLHSRDDARIPFDEGRALATLIPGARFVPLESRNHWLVENEPAWKQFAAELDDFLPAPGPASIGEGAFDDLTARERNVLELMAQGLDNDTIATALGIAEKTVRNHVSIVFDKLGVHSRVQAVVRARDAGFGKSGVLRKPV